MAFEVHDLESASQAGLRTACQVCVIGCGAAGIYLAARLASAGVDVAVLEAGGTSCVAGAQLGIDAVQTDARYAGADAGRAFGIGGSTSRWGGALMPFGNADLRPLHSDAAIWSQIVNAAKEHAPTVLQTVGYPYDSDFVSFAKRKLHSLWDDFAHAGIVPMATLFMPFGSRNLAGLLKTSSRRTVRVYTNAVAKAFQIRAGPAGARFISLNGVSMGGRSLSIAANEFVVAAGALESARLLLELPSSVIPAGAAVGQYLGDHLSISIADVDHVDEAGAARLFAPYFSGGWMRSFRFIEQPHAGAGPRAFAHLIFDNESPAFKIAREVLQSIQAGRVPKVRASEGLRTVVGLAELATKRYLGSRLHIPKGTSSRLQLDMEQTPSRSNRIQLVDEMDRYGRRKAAVHWRIENTDLNLIQSTADRYLKTWGRIASAPRMVMRPLDASGEKPHDTYHPTGTCRMGDDSEAVVDTVLKVRGTENLAVASTGVLPSAGTANPTFSMLCLAELLAARLIRKVSVQTS